MNLFDHFSNLLDDLCAELDRIEPREPKVLPKEELRMHCSPNDHTTGTGLHKHRCACGTTWKHSDEIAGGGVSESDFYEAHTCPSCGTENTYKHYAKGESWR